MGEEDQVEEQVDWNAQDRKRGDGHPNREVSAHFDASWPVE